jgi:D-3-phosphoglycerate dehydrogenase / 2-oxoglutarate reductase
MSYKILANDGIDPAGKSLLEKAGFTVISDKVAQEDLINTINEQAYVALTVRSATKVRKDLIDACPNLKVIARGGVGMDNIDVEYARSKGIEVINTPAASSNAVAELVMAHAFNAVRFLYDSNREMPSKGHTEFDILKKKYAKGVELRGKTFGMVGFGRIGQGVARMALGLGMKVIATDPFVSKTTIDLKIEGVDQPVQVEINTTNLENVFQNADFITFHVPGGALIFDKEIAMMKDGVILINTSRGEVIKEEPLINGLNSGKIAHACLDVFENEPHPSTSILQHPKISLSPHIGASTQEAQERIGIELAERVIASLRVIA